MPDLQFLAIDVYFLAVKYASWQHCFSPPPSHAIISSHPLLFNTMLTLLVVLDTMGLKCSSKVLPQYLY